ncbi:uncharacterized protein LOC143044720 isoform X1 [Mytilus galloprovincialis]|uniref:uncharacterized protein LOC143044720 isoform X1 n=1 Tax=Mytilus galloprovincialis TaxID=29158 RepID=UPI003F7B56F3
MALTDQYDICKLAFEGNTGILKKRIKENTELSITKDETNRMPLHWAISGGHTEIVEFLIKQGVPVDARDETGWTPLMIAASAGRYQIILMLIRNGAQVNAVNQTGQCSLHYAASKNRYEIAEMLLQQGADPDIGDQYNNTPLHRAASKGHVKLVKLLLQYNVDVNYRDSQNSTPFLLSSLQLLSRKLNHRDSDLGVTVTLTNFLNAEYFKRHWACEEERGEVAQLLVDRGADIAALNKEEKTPLDFVSATLRRSLENRTICR